MNQEPPRDSHSFVIRLWQEGPRRWRGTVRHVQSEAHRGFNRLDQAVAFIEKMIPSLAQMPVESNLMTLASFGLGRSARMRLAWAAAGVIAVVLFAIVLSSGNTTAPLSATAVTVQVPWEMLLAFAGGALVGGLLVGLWAWRVRR